MNMSLWLVVICSWLFVIWLYIRFLLEEIRIRDEVIANKDSLLSVVVSSLDCEWWRSAFAKTNDEICQTLGKALEYPWFKDDQDNFPGATEENGVCIGDHIAESLATEAAREITTLREQVKQLSLSLEDVICRSEDDDYEGEVF